MSSTTEPTSSIMSSAFDTTSTIISSTYTITTGTSKYPLPETDYMFYI